MDDHLSPSDAAIACRSLARRFRDAFAPHDGDRGDPARPDPDELGRRVGSDGRSAIDHLVAADGILGLVDRAVERGPGHPGEAQHPGLRDLSALEFADPATSLDVLLDRFADTARRLADRMDALHADDWAVEVRIAGSEVGLELLQVVRDGVAASAAHLRAAQRTMTEVR